MTAGHQTSSTVTESAIRWARVNDEPFEYAIQQGAHGDEFVKLLDGTCLRRHAQQMPPSVSQHIGWLKQYVEGMTADNWHDMRLRGARQLTELATAVALPLAQLQPQWQPIETVPKHEGLYLDLWFPQRAAGEYGRVPDCQWLGNETTPGWYAWCEKNDALCYIGDGATHWRHRPESPALPSTDASAPCPNCGSTSPDHSYDCFRAASEPSHGG